MEARRYAIPQLLLVLLLLTGCRTASVLNVKDAPIRMTGAESSEAVRGHIVRAAELRSWKLLEEGPEQLVVSKTRGSHSAVVAIQYDSSRFSIDYRDSVRLKYNGKSIHKLYNQWVEELAHGIGLPFDTDAPKKRRPHSPKRPGGSR